MERNDFLYPEDWFRIGAKEINRAETLLGSGDLEGAGFNIQQSLEKYLKGYLLSKGWKLRRIHRLDIILNDVIAYEPSFEEFRKECLKITEYYIEERYPATVSSNLTEEEVKNSLYIARKIIDNVLRLKGYCNE